jgi:hypothetical protein
MESASPATFAEHIERLDVTSRAFFENQFFNRGAFGETRQQTRTRVCSCYVTPKGRGSSRDSSNERAQSGPRSAAPPFRRPADAPV